jgi:glutathione S-transferase
MKLFYAPGACSLSPHIALREAERTFALERVDLKTHRTETGADFFAINPKGYVPVLQLDDLSGEVLTEGPAIVQYIADLAPDRRLAPRAGTFARYHLQEWLNFISTELHKAHGPLFAADTPSATQARQRGVLARRYGWIDGDLLGRAFLMGETFTVADCYLFAMLRWAERVAINLEHWPNLASYYARVLERPTVQTALAAEGLLDRKRHRRSA